MPRKYTPTPEQRDERVNTEEPADKLIQAILKAGPHPKDDDADDDQEEQAPKK